MIFVSIFIIKFIYLLNKKIRDEETRFIISFVRKCYCG